MIVALLFVLFACINTSAAIVTKARAHLSTAPGSIAEDSGTTYAGVLDFTQQTPDGPVKINGTIQEVKPQGEHGFHIHTFGDIEGSCLTAGQHFNPINLSHGAPTNNIRHVGDLGNVVSNSAGNVDIDFSDSTISLNGPHSIIGRSVVVHENRDDYGEGNTPDSKKTGNAGSRLICGVIGRILVIALFRIKSHLDFNF